VIGELTISNGITVEILNGELFQQSGASRFDNQGTVKVLANGDLQIGADRITGGGTIEIADGDVSVAPELDGSVFETIPIDQVFEGHGSIRFSRSRYDFVGDSSITADGGELVVNGFAENLTVTARDNSTLKLNLSLINSELHSEGTGVIIGGPTLSGRITNSANIIAGQSINPSEGSFTRINFGEGLLTPKTEFTNNGSVSAFFITVRSNEMVVDGTGTLDFGQVLDASIPSVTSPTLTIGAGQDWSGQGQVLNFSTLTSQGRFAVGSGGQLEFRLGTFVNEGVLSADGGTLNLNVGTYDFRNGTVVSGGGTVELAGSPFFDIDNPASEGPRTVQTEGSPGGLWDARSGTIKFGNMDNQWPGLATNFTLDHAEVWLGSNGDIELGDKEFVPGSSDPIDTPFVSIRQFIQNIGPNGILRILDGANYQPASSGDTPTVTGIVLKGLIELDGGTMTLTSNPLTNVGLDIQAGGHFLGFGQLDADVKNNGLVEVDGGVLTIDGTAQGGGEYLAHSGGELTILGPSTLGNGAQVTVDARTQAAAFTINATVEQFSGILVALLGQNSSFILSNGVPIENTLLELEDSSFTLSDGRVFIAQQSVTLKGNSTLRVDQATYQSQQGLTINNTSAVELINMGTLDLGGVLTINTPVGSAALSGSGLVRAMEVDSAGLIEVEGTTLRFEDTAIDQSRGGRLVVREITGGGGLGILELANVTVDAGQLSVLEGGIANVSGNLNGVQVLVEGAMITTEGGSLSVTGGTLTNRNLIRAQAGGEMHFQNVVIDNQDGLIEASTVVPDLDDNAPPPPVVDSVLSLDGATLSLGTLNLISVAFGAPDIGSTAMLRGNGQITGTTITLDRHARIEAGNGQTADTLTIDLAGTTLFNPGTLTTADQGGTLHLTNGEITGGGLIEARDGGVVEIKNVQISNASFSTVGDGVIVDLAQSTFTNLTNAGEFEVIGDVTFAGFMSNTAGATLDNQGSVAISAGTQLINSGSLSNASALIHNGTLDNYGTLALNAGSTFDNTGGVVNNHDGGVIDLEIVLSSGPALGAINLNAGSTLNSFAQLSTDALADINWGSGSTIQLFAGIDSASAVNILADRTLNNMGTLGVESRGALRNEGILSNKDGATMNINASVLANTGTLINTGRLALNTGSIFDNTGGILNNNDGGVIDLEIVLSSGPALGAINLNAGSMLNSFAQLSAEALADINWGSGSTIQLYAGIDSASAVNILADRTLNNMGTLGVESGGALRNEGILSNKDGATLDINDNLVITFNGGVSNNMAGGTININNNENMLIGFIGSGTLNNAGDLNINEGTIQIGSGGTVNNDGTLQNDDRLDVSSGGVLNNRAGSTLTNNAEVFNSGLFSVDQGAKVMGTGTYTQTDGSTVVNGMFNQSTIHISGGSLSGIGTVTGDVTVTGGTVGPGNSVGTLAIDGDLTFDTSAQEPATSAGFSDLALGPLAGNGVEDEVTLQIEIEGLIAGSGYDQVNVTQSVTLDGTLDLTLISDFVPKFGDAFVVVTAGTRSGTFDQINGVLPEGQGFALAPIYDYQDNIGLTLVTTLPGDVTLDGNVGIDDLLILLNNAGTDSDWIEGDFTGDRNVNLDDLLVLLFNAQTSELPSMLAAVNASPFSPSVPEPGTMAMVVLGSFAMLRRRFA